MTFLESKQFEEKPGMAHTEGGGTCRINTGPKDQTKKLHRKWGTTAAKKESIARGLANEEREKGQTRTTNTSGFGRLGINRLFISEQRRRRLTTAVPEEGNFKDLEQKTRRRFPVELCNKQLLGWAEVKRKGSTEKKSLDPILTG